MVITAVLFATMSALEEPAPSAPRDLPEFSRAALEETSAQADASRVSTWEAIRQRATQLGIAASLVYDGQGVVIASWDGQEPPCFSTASSTMAAIRAIWSATPRE